MVIETTGRGERAYDIYSRMLKERVIFWSARSRTTWPTWWWHSCCSWSRKPGQGHPPLHQLTRRGSERRPAIYDTMRSSAACQHRVHRPGGAHGCACCSPRGTQGKRFCLPHARMMVHQPMGGLQGQASDIDIHARDPARAGTPECDLGQTHRSFLTRSARTTPTATFMDGGEAKAYGLIDAVIKARLRNARGAPGRWTSRRPCYI